MKRTLAVMAAMMLMLTVTAAGKAENRDLPILRFQDAAVHDPSILRAENGSWYIFGSHMAAARSEDLIHWEMISRDAGRGVCGSDARPGILE